MHQVTHSAWCTASCITSHAHTSATSHYTIPTTTRYAQACGYLTSVERLDPRTGRWAAVASLGEVRACLGAVEILGVLYAVGGRNMLKAQPRAWAASWGQQLILVPLEASTVGSPYHTLGGGAPHSGVAAVPHRAQTRGRGTGSRLGQRCGLCGRPIPGGSDDAALSGSASSVARYDAAADRWEPLVTVTKDRVLALAARNLCSPLAAARAWRSYFCRCCSGTGGDEEPDQPL